MSFINKKPPTFLFLLTFFNVLFLGLYVVLSYHNRFSFEDFYFIETYKREGGFFEAINFYYQNWTGRWIAFAYFYLWFGFVSTTSMLNVCVFFYHLFSLSLFLWALYRIIKVCFNKLFNQPIPSLLILNFAILFRSALFFFSFQIIENWWWVCSTFFHIQSVIFLCFATALILNEKSNIITYTLVIVSGLYIGASSEVMATIVIVLIPVLAICFFGLNLKKIKEFVSSSTGKKVMALFLFIIFSFCSNVFSPGVMSRQEVLEGLSVLPKAENKELFRFYDSWNQPAIYIFLRPQYILFSILMITTFFFS